MKKVFNLMVAAMILVGCKADTDPLEYARDEKNGLKKTITVDNMLYTIQYKSPAYIVKMEHLDTKAAKEREQQLQGMVWFNLSLSVQDFNQSPLRYQVSGLEEYTQRQDYYLNRAAKDMYLLYGKDTLYVNSYWFENNQNLLPYETMVIGFKLPGEVKEPEEDLRFSFYDRVFGNGIIKTVIRKEDLENIPGL